MPVVLDKPVHYNLPRLASGPVLIDQAHPRSEWIPFVIPPPGAGESRYLKVVLRIRLQTARSCEPGYGYVNAETESGPSASVGITQKCGAAGRRLRWSTVTTAGTRAGRGRGRVVEVGLSNYVLRRDTRPGTHRLRFSLETAHGFRVRRVDVRASSGLRPTAEPPYTIDLAISPAKVTTRPGAPAAFDVAVRNGGTVPARRVSLSVIESDAMVVDNRSALEDWPVIRPKRVVRRRVRLLPRTPGAWLVDVAVDSSKGTDVETLRLVAERKTAVGGDGHGPSRTATGGWLAVIVALFALALWMRSSRRPAAHD